MTKTERVSFDEALKILGVNESKLKRFVAEGEIRAFREGDQMMFRRSDVENLSQLKVRPRVVRPQNEGIIDLSAGEEEASETTFGECACDEDAEAEAYDDGWSDRDDPVGPAIDVPDPLDCVRREVASLKVANAALRGEVDTLRARVNVIEDRKSIFGRILKRIGL